MKHKWHRRDGAKRLVVFFCGFACDGDFLCEADLPPDCDVVSIFDYRSLDFDLDISAYSEIGVAAWSFGVWVADYFSDILSRADARAAVCGTPFPVDHKRGIDPTIFKSTVKLFDESTRLKFYRRVCDSFDFGESAKRLSKRSASELKAELEFLATAFVANKTAQGHWTLALAAKSDRIFTPENIKRAWSKTPPIFFDGAHLNMRLIRRALVHAARPLSKVGGAFERSVLSYETNANVQKDVAKKLAEMVLSFGGEVGGNVLEIGCGTGFLTRELSGKLRSEKWYLNDLSLKMCQKAADCCSADCEIIAADILKCKIPENLGAIVSSSSVQWISDLPMLFKKLATVANSGAMLAFSTFGPRNYEEIKMLCGNSLYYPDALEIRDMLEHSGYRCEGIEESIKKVSFSTPRDVLAHIALTGVNGRFSSFWTPSRLRKFAQNYAKFFGESDNRVSLTYNPIYIIAFKK